eukprot:1700184-Prymnesium_polylepis.3
MKYRVWSRSGEGLSATKHPPRARAAAAALRVIGIGTSRAMRSMPIACAGEFSSATTRFTSASPTRAFAPAHATVIRLDSPLITTKPVPVLTFFCLHRVSSIEYRVSSIKYQV